uniref:Uncharacterized protein n=1 Tax=Oryza nivara TaxID=4536 RepID=A0A0E0IWQ9_ORYNI
MIAYSLDAVGEAVDEAVWLLQHLKKDAVEVAWLAASICNTVTVLLRHLTEDGVEVAWLATPICNIRVSAAMEGKASAGSRVTERHRPKNTARPPNPLTGIKSPASKSTL